MQTYRLEEFGSIEQLALHDEPTPEPGPYEVLVQVRASALNYRDLALVNGRYPMSCRTGLIPQSDGAGEIIAVGAEVTRFSVGARVAGIFFPRWLGGRLPLAAVGEQYGSDCDGWLTQFKVVNQDALVPIPAHLSYEQAACLPCAAVTAWSALGGATPIGAGDTVLTLGSGGVSLFAIQLAKLRGARVIATTSDCEKSERLKAIGADEIINYRTTPEWAARVRELTGGLGVERIVEVGGPGTIVQSLRAVALGGEVVLIGFVASEPTELSFQDLFMSNAVVRRIGVGSRDDFEAMNRAIDYHHLEPVIDRVFTFAEAKAAWAYFESRPHFGKVVIKH